MINWKNTAENLGLILIGVTVGVTIGHKVTKITSESLISQLTPTIEHAINKETIANTITNAIDMKIDKIKKSDTLQININQQPANDLRPISTINKSIDCGLSQQQYNKLSINEKKRLNRWLKD